MKKVTSLRLNSECLSELDSLSHVLSLSRSRVVSALISNAYNRLVGDPVCDIMACHEAMAELEAALEDAFDRVLGGSAR